MRIENDIQGKKVIVRTAEISDADFTYTIRQDKKKTEFVHALSGGIEEQKKWIQSQIDKEDSLFLVIADENNNPIGTYGIYNINFVSKTAELGRAMLNGNPVQNLEAIFLVHEYAFNQLAMEKLFTDTFKDNTSAVGVNKQVGGEIIEETYNEEFLQINYRFVITKEKYLQKRNEIKKLVDRFSGR